MQKTLNTSLCTLLCALFSITFLNAQITFEPTAIAANGVADLFAIDVDGDGLTDYSCADYIWYNDGDETYTQEFIQQVDFKVPFDLDGDGDMDFVGQDWGDNLVWWENTGDSFLKTILENRASPNYFHELDFADFNGDGRIDFVVTYVQQVFNGSNYFTSWWENTGTGEFIKHNISDSQRTHPYDIDGDGDIDLIGQRSESAQNPDDNRIYWFENTGYGNFLPHLIYESIDYPGSISVGDFNGDGKGDLVFGKPFSIFWNDGNDNFSLAPIAAETLEDIVIADMDGDGKDEILKNYVSLDYFQYNGGNSFSKFQLIPSSLYLYHVSDVDSDGDLDIANIVFGNPSIQYLDNQGAVCPAGGTININSQAELVDFGNTYADCDNLDATLILSGSDIMDLSPLNHFTTISSLRITYCNALMSLNGLNPSLQVTGELYIAFNETLLNCSIEPVCIKIASDEENITLFNNAAECFDIPSVSFSCSGDCPPGNIVIDDDYSIQSFIADFPNCTNIYENVTIAVTNSTNLNGLQNIEAIYGELAIAYNEFLTSLSGLSGLKHIGGKLIIADNPELTSLNGLNNLEFLGNLQIDHNDKLNNISALDHPINLASNSFIIATNAQLSNCNVQTVCNNLGGSSVIWNNGANCDSDGDVFAACGFQCPSADIVISDQTDIDDLIAQYGFCSSFPVSLTIDNDGSQIDMSGLSFIESIDGDLIIESNNNLFELTGLENISTIGGNLSIIWNQNLSNLQGLSGLNNVDGNVTMERLTSVKDMSGLENLISIGGDLRFEDMYGLENLTGLNGLTSISNDFLLLENNELVSTIGLENLLTIGSRLYFNNNPKLESINLDALTSVGEFDLSGNQALYDISSLDHAFDIGSMYIHFNFNLSYCSVQSFCDHFVDNTDYPIDSNGPGCNFESEVQANCDETETLVCSGAFASSVFDPDNVVITMSPAPNALGHILSIGTTPGGTDILDKEDIGDATTYTLSGLDYSTTYYISVIGYSGFDLRTGCPGNDFTTVDAPLPMCVSVTSPVDGSVDNPIYSDLSWPALMGEPSYKVSLGTTAGGTDVLNKVNAGTATSFSLPNLDFGTTYYATITPYNATGDAAACNAVSFTTIENVVLDCVTFSIPTSGSSDVDVDADLSWTSVADATSYSLTMGTVSGGNDILNNITSTGTNYVLPALDYNTTYYLTITPFNAEGSAEDCNEISFTTQGPPPTDCTNLIVPTNGATGISINTDVTWNPVDNVFGYFISAGTSSGGTDILNNIDAGNVQSYTLPTLTYNTQIFITITPYGESGSAMNCSEEIFTTALPPAPSCTNLLSPQNTEEEVSVNITISWNSVSDADGYYVTIGTNSGSADVADNVDITNGFSFDPGLLAGGTAYYVTIIPYNAGGQSTDCTEEVFYTEIMEIPSCVAMTFPINGATNVTKEPQITWEENIDADGYNFSMGTALGLTDVYDNVDVGLTNLFDAGTLDYNTTYYVTIVPYNNNGNAMDCITETFTTETIESVITVTCPESETYEVVEGTANSIFVSWDEPTFVSTTCPSGIFSIQQVSGPQGGSTSINVPGGTSVTYVITDECGGVETCSFSIGAVYVPLEFSVDCPSSITVETSDPNGAIVNYETPSIITNCDGITNIIPGTGVIPSGSVFPVGENPQYFELELTCGSQQPTDDCLFFINVNYIPPCTNLSSPLDGVTDVSLNPTLSWDAVEGVSGYLLSVGTSSGATDIVNEVFVSTGTTYDLSDLENGTEYFVNIVPFNSDNGAVDCIEESFTTETIESVITVTCPESETYEVVEGTVNSIFVSWDEPTFVSTTCPSGIFSIQQVSGPQGGSTSINVPGGTSVTYVITDECGGVETCSFSIGAVYVPLEFSVDCPSSITVFTDDPNTGVAVDYDTPSINTNCDGLTNITPSAGVIPSGSVFPVGENPQYFDLTLNCGGTEYTDDCLFFVNVLYVPSAIECTAITNPVNGATDVDVNSSINWSAVDNATGYLLSIGTIPGVNDFMNELDVGNVTTFSLGQLGYNTTYYVTVTPYNGDELATDCVEEIFTTEALITTLTVSCPQDIVVEPLAGMTMATVTWDEPTATTTCQVGNITVTQINGDANGSELLENSQQTIVYEIADDCGNSEQCTFIVSVTENSLVNNTICPSDIIIESSNENGAVVTYDAPYSDNNCTQGSSSALQIAGLPSGTLFPVGITAIEYEVTLECNGETYTDICSFNVTVNYTPSDCPPAIAGFTVLGEFDNHKYFISDNPASWMSASATAAANGAYLASINDAAENEFLRSTIGNNIVFIGLNDAETEGDYQWDSGEAFTYDFIETPPNDGADDFANMNFWSGGWSFDNQYVQRRYIIETTCGPVPTSLSVDCISDVNVTISLDQTSTIVNYDLPSYTATCSDIETVEVNLINGLESGSVFNVGTTVIEYEIILACGDEILSETCQFEVTVEQSDITCPEVIDGFSFLGTYNDHNYFLSDNIQSWPSAAVMAAANDGYLVSMNDANENEFVRSQIGNNIVFIGLSDAQSEGNYEWNSGEPFTFDFIETAGSSPDEDYAHMNFWSGGWAFDINYVQRRFVMEVDCGPQAPELTVNCPLDQVYAANLGDTEGTVNWTEPSAFTTCPDANITFTQTTGPAIGSIFQVDQPQSISYEITDECGNTSTCTFTVTLESTVATLTVDCPQNQVYVASPGVLEEVIIWTDVTAMTTCPTQSITYSQQAGPSNGSVLQVDTPVLVEYDISDECDNISTCSFTVTLSSSSANMTVSCPADQVFGIPEGQGSQVVTWEVPTATTDCLSNIITTTLTSSIENGSIFQVGQSEIVTYELADECGNSQTCSFTVSLQAQSSECPDAIDNFEFLGEFEGHKYFKALQPKRWMEAQQIAEDLGGYLVSINNAAENEFIKNNISVITMIGLSDVANEGELVWDSGEPLDYNFVEATNDDEGDFASINFWNGGWLFVNQWVQKPYIIEFNCQPTGPVLTVECVDDIVMTADPGVTSMAINWELPFAMTTCPDGNITTTQLTGSGSGASFDVGQTDLITYEFADECGNTSTCSFNVTLNEFELTLDVDCPEDILLTVEEGVLGATVDFDAPFTFSNCPSNPINNITQLTGDPSGSVFPLGTTVIEFEIESDCNGEILVEQCSFTITIEENSSACPDQLDDFEFLGEFGGHHYFLSQIPTTWALAQDNAADLGAYLVSITTMEENEFLRSNISDIVMTGLNDQNVEGQFEWDSGEPFDYSFITDGNAADSDFGTINFWNGGWGTVNQWVQKPYIIEFSCGNTEQARMSFANEIAINNIYPNPTSQNVTIEVSSSFENRTTVQIFDVFGKLKLELPIELRKGSSRITMDISDLDEGIHFVRIRGNEARSKFIKINQDSDFLNN